MIINIFSTYYFITNNKKNLGNVYKVTKYNLFVNY